MDEMEKLSIVIEHWIEHNQSHMDEYQRWAQTAGDIGLEKVEAEIKEAIEKLSHCNNHFGKALKELRVLQPISV